MIPLLFNDILSRNTHVFDVFPLPGRFEYSLVPELDTLTPTYLNELTGGRFCLPGYPIDNFQFGHLQSARGNESLYVMGDGNDPLPRDPVIPRKNSDFQLIARFVMFLNGQREKRGGGETQKKCDEKLPERPCHASFVLMNCI
jgi:hypothetical protein